MTCCPAAMAHKSLPPPLMAPRAAERTLEMSDGPELEGGEAHDTSRGGDAMRSMDAPPGGRWAHGSAAEDTAGAGTTGLPAASGVVRGMATAGRAAPLTA